MRAEGRLGLARLLHLLSRAGTGGRLGLARLQYLIANAKTGVGSSQIGYSTHCYS